MTLKYLSDIYKSIYVQVGNDATGHNLSGIASQFAMQFGLNCDVIHVLHRSD